MDSGAQQSLTRFDYLLTHIDLEAYGRAMEQMDPDALGAITDMTAAAALSMIDDVAGGEWNDDHDMQQMQRTHELEELCVHSHITDIDTAILARAEPDSAVGSLSSRDFALMERILLDQ